MKLKNFLAMMAIALCAVACSDDDEKTEDVNLAQEVAGTYNGYTSAAFTYSPTPTVTPKETVKVTDKGDSKVDITLTSATWGEYKLTDVPVTLSGSTYSMSGSGNVTIGGYNGGGSSEYPFELKGTIDAAKEEVSFVVTLNIMGGTTITFTEGDAPVAAVLAGTYNGNLELSVAGSSQGDPVESSVKMEAAEDGSLTMTLAGFAAMGGMQLGDIVITGVEATTDDYSSYALSGTVNADVAMGQASIKVTGEVEGTVKDGKADITFTLTPGAMPMAITAKFTSAE